MQRLVDHQLALSSVHCDIVLIGLAMGHQRGFVGDCIARNDGQATASNCSRVGGGSEGMVRPDERLAGRDLEMAGICRPRAPNGLSILARPERRIAVGGREEGGGTPYSSASGASPRQYMVEAESGGQRQRAEDSVAESRIACGARKEDSAGRVNLLTGMLQQLSRLCSRW
jgi:hypothetical protein